MSGLDQLRGLVGWYFLPPLLAKGTLSTLYYLLPAFRPQVPPNPPPALLATQNLRAQTHARNARVGLVVLYLVYTLINTFYSQSLVGEMNFYTLLDVSKTSFESPLGGAILKTRWRNLARSLHPDKVGPTGAATFVHLRRAVEVLESPDLRFGYERFGLHSLEWGKRSMREMLERGLISASGFYMVMLGSLWLFSLNGPTHSSINYYRFLALLCLFSVELSLLLHPSQLLQILLPNRVQFEHIAFLRQFFIATLCALSQLVPLFLKPSTPKTIQEILEKEMAGIEIELNSMKELVTILEREVDALQRVELTPILIDLRPERRAEMLEGLKRGMGNCFSDSLIIGSEKFGEIWQEAVKSEIAKREVEQRELRQKEEEEEEEEEVGSREPVELTSTPPPSLPRPLLLPLSQPLTLPPLSPSLTATPSPPTSLSRLHRRSVSSSQAYSPSSRILGKSWSGGLSPAALAGGEGVAGTASSLGEAVAPKEEVKE